MFIIFKIETSQIKSRIQISEQKYYNLKLNHHSKDTIQCFTKKLEAGFHFKSKDHSKTFKLSKNILFLNTPRALIMF